MLRSVSVFRVTIAEATRFMADCLQAAGANRQPAEEQAELLIQADIMGHPSHGMNRLERYVNDIQSGSCEPNNIPEVLKETCSTAWIDAKNVLGATVGNIAMDTAIRKAFCTGVGWVTVKQANHNGIAGYWAKKAACEGLIGISLTNGSPIVAPTRSKEAALGTNPIAVAAPGCDNELFYLDVSTSAVAFGRIEMQGRRNKPLPSGWAMGPDGKETHDPYEALRTKRLYPLGGLEITSGYKGFGLSAMVELFCGISAGSNYSHLIPVWQVESTGEKRNLGQCFAAVNPDCFAPGFCDRLTECLRHWRQLKPVDPHLPVLVPGDLERRAAANAYATGQVTFVQVQIENCIALAERLNVKPMALVTC